MDPELEPVQRPDRRRAGFLWGAGLMVVLLIPIAATFILALIAYGGCFIGCQEPEPLAGALLFVAAIAMVFLPFVIGSAISQRSRRNWITALWLGIAMVLCLVVGLSSSGF